MPFVDYQLDGLMDFTGESIFSFEVNNQKIDLSIKPLDEQVKQLYISVKIYTPAQLSKATTKQNKKSTEQDQASFFQQSNNNLRSHQSSDPQSNSMTIVEYTQVFDIWDFVSFKSQKHRLSKDHHSLLWIKLYLHQYFRNLSLQFQNQKSLSFQKETTLKSLPNNQIQLFSDTFNFTDQIFMKKIHKNQKHVIRILEELQTQTLNQRNISQDLKSKEKLSQLSENQQSQHLDFCSGKKSIFIKINPKLIKSSNSFFESTFLLNLPRKCTSTQKVISKIQIQSDQQLKRGKQIQDIFFDYKHMH